MRIGDNVGCFRLVRLLAQGGMGAVFEARNEQLGRRVAIKLLHASLACDPELNRRFLSEARVVNLISHPSLVTIHEYGTHPGGNAYIVMEFLEGQTLAQVLQARRGDSLPISQTVRIARQVASALVAVHDKEVVHRDLKPDNLMLVSDPEVSGGERVKVLDFGIAKVKQPAASAARMTRAGVAMGTPGYIAPEQVYGASSVDGRADVYSLGVILYEMLSGSRPFHRLSGHQEMHCHLTQLPQPLLQRVPETPAALANLVHCMLAKQPAERPTMREVVERLHEVEFSTTGSSVVGMAAQGPVSRRTLASLALAGALLAAVSSLLYLRTPFWGGASLQLMPTAPQHISDARDAGALDQAPPAPERPDMGGPAVETTAPSPHPAPAPKKIRASKSTPVVRAPLDENEIVQLR